MKEERTEVMKASEADNSNGLAMQLGVETI